MTWKDQDLEAIATIRMAINNNDALLERLRNQGTDTTDFQPSMDDDDGNKQFEAGTHWTLGLPDKLTVPFKIMPEEFPAFENQLRERMAELMPEEFSLGHQIPIKVSIAYFNNPLVVKKRSADTTVQMYLSWIPVTRRLDRGTRYLVMQPELPRCEAV